MKSIQEVIQERKERKKVNPRQELVNQCAKLVNRPYPQMASLLKGYPPHFISDLLKSAREFKQNPPARFWQLLKESKIKE